MDRLACRFLPSRSLCRLPRRGPLVRPAISIFGGAALLLAVAGQPATAATAASSATTGLDTAATAASATGSATFAGQPEAHAAPAPPAAADAPAAPRLCDGTSALTLIGMDTESGAMLFAVAGPSGATGSWVIELDGAGREAHAFADRGAGRFGGSVGPGPVVAVEPCGGACLQPVRWSAGAWQPLGEPLTVPGGSTAAASYDDAGAPWLVAHAATPQSGQMQAWSFRYEDHRWKSRGGLTVAAVGQPQVLPSPQRRDGVVSGTGLFSASASPETWVTGLPGLPAERRGQLLPLGGSGAAYVSADGVAYLSSDSGKSWRRSTWTPWGGGETTGMWRQGSDYGIDLPLADHRGGLQLVWFDRRSRSAEQVVLTRLGAGGDWTTLAQTPSDVTTRNGDHLPVSQVLVPHAGSWVLLSGCAATATGPGLVLRTFEQGHLSEPRFVPIVTGAAGPATAQRSINPHR